MVTKREWEQGLQPISSVLSGLSIHPVEDGERPVAAFVIIKTLDDEGVSNWVTRKTGWDEPSDEELLGVLTVQQELARRDALGPWLDEE
jgi:hypothetical protein